MVDPMMALDLLDVFDIFSGRSSSSDEDGDPGWFERSFLSWLRTPDPEKEKGRSDWEYDKFHERDNVWSDFHLLDGDWVEIMNKKEWYEAPHVPTIYTDHKKIVKLNMGMSRPFEDYYYQNVDNNEFESNMHADEDLPSEQGEFRLVMEIETVNPPSGENEACTVEYFVRGKIKYDVPNGVDFLPRLVAYPLNRFFKWAYLKYLGDEQIEYDGEYARERINEYFHYIRKYHGEEPIQTKTRQAEYKPVPEEGVFFQ